MQLMKNPVKQALRTTDVFAIIGVLRRRCGVAGYAGFDFVRIDISHNGYDYRHRHMIRAAEAAGVTRWCA